MITGIIIAAAVVGILGILIGVFLGVASEKFKVETDEKEILVRNELPGNNCGGGKNRRHHGRGRRKRCEESGFCKV